MKKIPTDEYKPRFLTSEEMGNLLKAAKGKYFEMILALLLTGCRVGEILNLKWSDIDFERDVILIQSKDGWSVKTRRSREVPLDKRLKSAFKAMGKKSDYVFCNLGGRKYDYFPRKAWSKIRKKASLPNLKAKDLRSSLASHLASSGKYSIFELSKILGNSVSVCEKHYARFIPRESTGADFAGLMGVKL